MELTAYLETLKKEGSGEGEGVFTIDSSKAKVKLSSFQFASFSQVAEILYSVAVSTNTATLKVQTSQEFLTGQSFTDILYEGFSLSERELRDLLFTGLNENTPHRFRYLASALSALCRKKPVQILSQTSSATFHVELSEEGIEELKLPGKIGFEGTRLRIFADLSGFESRLSDLVWWSSVDLEFDDRAHYGGIALETGINQGNLFYRNYKDPVIPLWMSDYQKRLEIVEPSNEEYPIFLLHTAKGEADVLGLSIVVDGLPYDTGLQKQFPNFAGFVIANHLRRDLSFSSLVENNDYAEVLHQLKGRISSAIDRLSRSAFGLPDGQVTELMNAIKALSKDFDLSQARSRCLDALDPLHPVPAGDVERMERLKERVGERTEDSALTLAHKYRVQARTSWLSGSVSSSLAYLKGERELRDCGALNSDVRQAAICDLLITLGSAISLERESIGKLEQILNSKAHRSWSVLSKISQATSKGDWLALEAKLGTIPPWFEFWRDCSQREIGAALDVLQSRRDLKFDSAKREWLSLVLGSYRGSLSWIKNVQLGAQLSLSQLARSGFPMINRQISELRGAPYWEVAVAQSVLPEILIRQYRSPEFWPCFFAVLTLARKYDQVEFERAAWLGLAGQKLMEMSFENPDAAVFQSSMKL